MYQNRKKCIIKNIDNKIVLKKYKFVSDYNNEINLIPILNNIYKESPHIAVPHKTSKNIIFYKYFGIPLSNVLKTLNLYDCTCILYQILYTIKIMNKYKFIHKDLHLNNILVKQSDFEYNYDIRLKSNYIVTIIDFNNSIINNRIEKIDILSKASLNAYKYDIVTFSIRFIQNCTYILLRELILDFFDLRYIKYLRSIYIITDNKNLIYNDIFNKDYRSNYLSIHNINDILDKVHIFFNKYLNIN